MSVKFEKDDFKIIEFDKRTLDYIENGVEKKFKMSEKVFMNFNRKSKSKQEISEENKDIKEFLTFCKETKIFKTFCDEEIERYKEDNIELMKKLYDEECNNFKEFYGENKLNTGVITLMNDGKKYLIPAKCKFFNKKIEDLNSLIQPSEKFDYIVIDPPWKNRYIKRLKKKNRIQSYNMMSDECIMNIPIENYTQENSIVVIWCTNSSTHQNAIEQKFLSKWKLKIIAKWKWIKLDMNGDLFGSLDGSKKPYEMIYICSHETNNLCESLIPKNLILFSHSSSIHSHKPRLEGFFSHILPSHDPKCLEIFARSLFSNFTSIGMEVLKLQNILLYEEVPTCSYL